MTIVGLSVIRMEMSVAGTCAEFCGQVIKIFSLQCNSHAIIIVEVLHTNSKKKRTGLSYGLHQSLI
jgi:hypothetical protein